MEKNEKKRPKFDLDTEGGHLLLAADADVKRTLIATAGAVACAAVISMVLLRYMPHSGPTAAVGTAILAYVLYRVFYKSFFAMMAEKKLQGHMRWFVTKEEVVLGPTVIDRSAIRNVHCWPNRDALGNVLGGWTVNIETTGKNHLLRSLKEGPDMERSVNSLHALVEAMGYGRNWKEQ